MRSTNTQWLLPESDPIGFSRMELQFQPNTSYHNRHRAIASLQDPGRCLPTSILSILQDPLSEAVVCDCGATRSDRKCAYRRMRARAIPFVGNRDNSRSSATLGEPEAGTNDLSRSQNAQGQFVAAIWPRLSRSA